MPAGFCTDRTLVIASAIFSDILLRDLVREKIVGPLSKFARCSRRVKWVKNYRGSAFPGKTVPFIYETLEALSSGAVSTPDLGRTWEPRILQ